MEPVDPMRVREALTVPVGALTQSPKHRLAFEAAQATAMVGGLVLEESDIGQSGAAIVDIHPAAVCGRVPDKVHVFEGGTALYPPPFSALLS